MERKGARRRSEIPPAVLAALNAGREPTRNLVEWLAIDMPALLHHAAGDAGLGRQRRDLVAQAEALRDEGVTRRMKGIGAALHEAIAAAPNGASAYEKLAAHRSDMVRAWACYALAADASPALPARFERSRRFAADSAFSVRECAWDGFRPYLMKDPDAGTALLAPWVQDADPNIRRCAVEATRPRGVWCAHFPAMKAEPDRGLPLLEPVRADPSLYVRKSAANWINDASKDHPDWARTLCARWERESPGADTAWLVRHALRTLRAASAFD